MEQPKKQLNPFAFPAETDVRFTLFVLAALFWVVVWGPNIVRTVGGLIVNPDDISGASNGRDLVNALGLTALVVGVAALLFVLYPWRLIRREKLKAFDAQSDAQFSAALEGVGKTAGLNTLPTLMLQKGNELEGQVFGLPGQYVLKLNEGLRLALRKAPALFHALVAHELAHLVNRDVARTYFAQALWTSTMVCAMIPFLSALLITIFLSLFVWHGIRADFWQRLFLEKLPLLFLIATPFLLSALLVRLLRASLLRVREAYADWRAALWGARQGLEEILDRTATAQTGRAEGWRARLRARLKLHPTSRERLGYLRKPERLFHITREFPLFVGWLAAVIALGEFQVVIPATQAVNDGTAQLLDALTQSGSANALTLSFVALVYWMGWIVTLAPPLILGYLVVGSLGLGVFRHAVADAYLGRRGVREYLRLGVPALMMSAGLYLSSLATPTLLIASQYLETYVSFLSYLPLYTIGIWVCLALARYLGIRLLAGHTGNRPPTWKRRAATAYISALLAILLVIFTNQQLFIPTAATQTEAERAAFIQALNLIDFQIIGIGFACVWALLSITFVGTFIWNRVRGRACPQCGARVESAVVVGKQCSNCHAELAAWAVVQ